MDISLENPPAPADDCWSSWLNHGRDGGNAAMRAHVAVQTAAFAEKILNPVQTPPATMLDIGSGDGLMAWAALSRWPRIDITMTDISPALLSQARMEAANRGAASQCNFVLANAETLKSIADNSQDLVTSRSALAYVADKPASFRAAFRVLIPGGIFSIAEPLFREQAHSTSILQKAFTETANPLPALLYRWKAAQFENPSDTEQPNPMTSYNERDLLSFARQAGFQDLHMELHIDERQAPPRDWEVFCAMSPHPQAPSSAEILATRFSPAERQILEAALRPRVEKGGFSITSRMIYLRGRKPEIRVLNPPA
ncbi:MAG: methyltransferase domain-containing protein [Rhodospirillales bacterium]|nr:methyltransferase domain-containing protein [Rhodospirillales bacterium]